MLMLCIMSIEESGSEKVCKMGADTLRMAVLESLQGVIPVLWAGRDVLKLSDMSVCLQYCILILLEEPDYCAISFKSLIRG